MLWPENSCRFVLFSLYSFFPFFLLFSFVELTIIKAESRIYPMVTSMCVLEASTVRSGEKTKVNVSGAVRNWRLEIRWSAIARARCLYAIGKVYLLQEKGCFFCVLCFWNFFLLLACWARKASCKDLNKVGHFILMIPVNFCLPPNFDFNRKLSRGSHNPYNWRGIQEDYLLRCHG